MLPHQYLHAIILCKSHFNFWVKTNNCFNPAVPCNIEFFALHHSSAVIDSCYLNHSREIMNCFSYRPCQHPVNRAKTVQQHLKEAAGLMLEITCVQFQVGI